MAHIDTEDHCARAVQSFIFMVGQIMKVSHGLRDMVNVEIFVVTIFCGLNFQGDKFLWVRVANRNHCC